MRNSMERGRPTKFRSAGLAVWVRADVRTLTSGNVSSWTDLSGNSGRDLANVTGTKQPLWVTSGTPNGRPTVRFDGVDDFLGPATFTLNQPFTVLHTVKVLTITAAGGHDVLYDGGTTGTTVMSEDTTPSTNMFAGGANLVVASNLANNAFAQITQVWRAAAPQFRANRVALSTSGTLGANNAGGFMLGALASGARSINAEWAEFMAFSTELWAGAMWRVESYQKAWACV